MSYYLIVITFQKVQNILLLFKKKKQKKKEEKAEEESESVWDGKLKRIKKHLENSVTEQNKILKELENHFESSFRIKAEQRAREIESVTDRNFEQLSFNYDMVDKLITKWMKSLNQDEKVAEQAK